MNIAVAGLGHMGSPIAERLLEAGHTVSVYNRTAEKAAPLAELGARVVPDLGALWASADTVITMLSDSAALLAITLPASGIVAAGPAGRTLIDMSTVSPSASAQVAEAAEAAGIAFLRAPVSGNPAVVRAGNLAILVSGAREAFEAAQGLLRDIGPNVFYLGDGEVARVMKLVLNLIVAGTAELLAEGIRLGEAFGLRREPMLEVMGGSAVGSPFVKYKTAALIAGDYSATFTTQLMRKDLDLIDDIAGTADLTLPFARTVRELLGECIAEGYGDLDFMALLLRLERQADSARTA